MKKYLLAALIFCTSLTTANSAEIRKKSYIGIGYQLNSITYNQSVVQLSNSSKKVNGEDYFADKFGNVNFFAGYEILEDKDLDGSVDLEVGYFSKNNVSKKNNNTGVKWNSNGNPVTTKSESNLSIVNLDVILNYHASEYFKMLLIGGVAGIFYKNNIDLLDNGVVGMSNQDKQNGIGYNAGVGGELKIINDVSARAIVKYTAVSWIDAFDRIITYGVGIKYNF